MILLLDGAPHVIEEMHTKASPIPGTNSTLACATSRRRLIDRVFAENERVTVAPLETRR